MNSQNQSQQTFFVPDRSVFERKRKEFPKTIVSSTPDLYASFSYKSMGVTKPSAPHPEPQMMMQQSTTDDGSQPVCSNDFRDEQVSGPSPQRISTTKASTFSGVTISDIPSGISPSEFGQPSTTVQSKSDPPTTSMNTVQRRQPHTDLTQHQSQVEEDKREFPHSIVVSTDASDIYEQCDIVQDLSYHHGSQGFKVVTNGQREIILRDTVFLPDGVTIVPSESFLMRLKVFHSMGVHLQKENEHLKKQLSAMQDMNESAMKQQAQLIEVHAESSKRQDQNFKTQSSIEADRFARLMKQTDSYSEQLQSRNDSDYAERVQHTNYGYLVLLSLIILQLVANYFKT